MTIREHAENLGVDEKELAAFYRGIGPKPKPKTKSSGETKKTPRPPKQESHEDGPDEAKG